MYYQARGFFRHLLKYYKWEFWPFWFFYIPIYPYWFYLSLKARSLVFFSAANPLMEMGGFSNYSKYNVLRQIPAEFCPKMLLLSAKSYSDHELAQAITSANLHFPLIAKPDRGERGKKVCKIHSLAELRKHLSAHPKDSFILQELIDLPLEFGIMYHRLPANGEAAITSIVQKQFLSIKGNGKDKVGDLLKAHHRAHLFYPHIRKHYPEKLDIIPAPGEILELEPIGNHSRGTIFLDARHLNNQTLLEVFDQLSQQIEGFYFGRYDLRAASIEDLYQGKFKILELNGVNSEPAHIYDPQMPLWAAYRHLFKHWYWLYQVSTQSHTLGNPYLSFRKALHKLFQY